MSEMLHSSLQPDLRRAILEEASQQTEPATYESYLGERLEVENAIVDFSRNHGEGTAWTYSTGDYRDRYVPNLHPSSGSLSGMELLWTKQLDRALKAKGDQPVVLLDFGGGMGFSAMRVASQPIYKKAIQDRRLVVAVSNLGFMPQDEPDADGYTKIARLMQADNQARRFTPQPYTEQDLRFVQDNQNLVTFVDASVLELYNDTSSAPVPLKNNIDILHESRALTHTQVPDIALATFAGLLSPGGVLYLDVRRMSGLRGDAIDLADGRTVTIDEKYREQRELSLEVGLSLLPRMGVVPTSEQPGTKTYVRHT